MPKYDYDLIVIGGGAAGLTASTGAGQLGAKTLLIEKHRELGGDCLHYGCVPSKSLIKSAYCYNILKNSEKYGLPKVDVPELDFTHVRDRLRNIIGTIQEHDTPQYVKEKYNVETQFGCPRFIDEHTIILNDAKITSKYFFICTGSSPVIPSVEGLDKVPFITNRDIFYLDKLPSSLVIMGGGPIGMEMAQAFARFGSKVTVVEFTEYLLSKEDPDISEFIRKNLEAEGITVLTKYKAVKAEGAGDQIRVCAEHTDTKEVKGLLADKLLVATGRKANVHDLGLEDIGVDFTTHGIKVDRRLRTNIKNIYACGDVSGGYQFTHVAGYEAGIAVVNTIMHLPVKANYTNVPWCTYLDPEVASVGYNEKRAKDAGLEYAVQKEEFKHNDRALAEGETEGFIKILINKKGKVIGVQIVGFHAGDLIHEWIAALNGKVSLSRIAQAIHAYPTLSEISKGASANFLSPKLFNNTTRKILKLVFGLQGEMK